MSNCNININLTQEINTTLPAQIQEVFSCYSLAAKNIRNKTIFFISNIQSSYVFNKETKLYSLKSTLHTNEQNVISNANLVISLLNKKTLDTYNQKLKQFDNKIIDKTPKYPAQLSLFSNVIDQKTFAQSINKSLIENLIKFVEKDENNLNNNFKDYTILNSVLAQNVVQKVCDDFAHYFKSLISYFNNKTAFKAKPQKPSYKSKNDLSSFEVSSARINKNGSILTINKNHKLFFDFQKQKQLTDTKIIDFYNNFDFNSIIQQDIKDKNLFDKYSKELKVTLLRVVPLSYSKYKFKLQYTISFPMELKGIYSEIIAQYPDFLKQKDSDKYKIIKEYINKKSDKNNLNNKSIPCFASMDLGHVNIASIYYFNGLDNIGSHKADIVSSKNFISRINKLDLKIDKQKQSFYNPKNKADQLTIDVLNKIETNRLNKEFNQKLAFGVSPKPMEIITKPEQKLLIEHSKRIYEDKLIRKSTYRKSNITKDYLHKLSKQIVDNLVNKGINLLIIGKNKDWKQEINIGSKNNRRAYNLPHTKLIELLKYKCILKNILIIEQEESYTSKTSFAHNEKIKTYEKNIKYKKEKITQGKKSQLSSVSNVVREGQKLYYILKDKETNKKGKKILICHADLNGAMNIGRKAIPEFNIETIGQSKQNKEIYGYRIVRLRNYSIEKQMFAEIKK